MDKKEYGEIVNRLPEIIPFIEISEDAFKIYVETININLLILEIENNYEFYKLLAQAKNNSYSIRLLCTWGQPIEALALLRVRLEQSIISSYLLYENPKEGIEAYRNYLPKAENKSIELFESLGAEEKKLFEQLMPDIFSMIKENIDVHKEKYPDNDLEKNNPISKWTTKSIYKLAKRRDELAPKNDSISGISFEQYFKRLYHFASSIVHSDSVSTSEHVLTKSPTGIMMPQILYIFTDLMECAQLDIIQCYEQLEYFKIDKKKEFRELHQRYLNEVLKSFDITLPKNTC